MADQGPQSAAKVSNGSSRVSTDDLYDALGRVTAGIDLRKKEIAQDQAAAQRQQQDLLAKRKLAEQSGDVSAFDALTAQVDELDERLRLMAHDLDEDDGTLRQPEHNDGERFGDERNGDGDPGDDGDKRPLADQGADRDGHGRDGDADGEDGERDDDPGAASGGAGHADPAPVA